MFGGCRKVGLHRERWNWTIWSIDNKSIYICLLRFGISLCKFLPQQKHKSRSHKHKLQLIVQIEDTLAIRRCPNISRFTFAMKTYILYQHGCGPRAIGHERNFDARIGSGDCRLRILFLLLQMWMGTTWKAFNSAAPV